MYMNSDLCTIGSKYATGLLLINLLTSTGRPYVESLTLRRFPAKKVERGYHGGIGELNCSSGEGQGWVKGRGTFQLCSVKRFDIYL